MTDADRRALTPLFWTHVNLYGKFALDMSTRLDLDALLAAARPASQTPAATFADTAVAGPPRPR